MQAPKARAKIVTEYIVKFVDYENLVNRTFRTNNNVNNTHIVMNNSTTL